MTEMRRMTGRRIVRPKCAPIKCGGFWWALRCDGQLATVLATQRTIMQFRAASPSVFHRTCTRQRLWCLPRSATHGPTTALGPGSDSIASVAMKTPSPPTGQPPPAIGYTELLFCSFLWGTFLWAMSLSRV